MAIGIKLKKITEKHDLGISKFFGTPTLPLGMLETLSEDTVFVAQINLKDISTLDIDNKLPHDGYLYFFIETSDDSPYTNKKGIVIYSKEIPSVAIDDFNLCSIISEGLNDDYAIEFKEVSEDYDGIKLLGNPSNYDYDNLKLLLQFDPLDTEGLDFFSSMDGYIYFFFDKKSDAFEDVFVHFEYS